MFFIVPLILIILSFSQYLVTFYTDWLWFGEVGYLAVFWKILLNKIILAGAAGLLFFGVNLVNVLIALKNLPKDFKVIKDDLIEVFSSAEKPGVFGFQASVVLLILGVVSLFVGLAASSLWKDFLFFKNPEFFSEAVPFFNRDIGFFIFQLPFVKAASNFLIFSLLVSLGVAGFIYFSSGGVSLNVRGLVLEEKSRRHFLIMLAIIFVLFGWTAWLGAYQLLYSSRGLISGPGFTDIKVILPAIKILVFLFGLAALSFIASIFRKDWKLPAAGVGLVIVWAILGRGIFPEIIQRLIVAPNEIEKEKPFIENHLKYTRQAYDLENLKTAEFPADENLTKKDILANQATLANIRLWDHRPLLDTYKQLQEIRTYYSFFDVDVDRYKLGSRYQQVMLAVREIDSAKLPSRIWINENLIYTHGYGLVMSPVSVVTQEGLPELILKDIPPMVLEKGLEVVQPAIYFGEGSNDYCLVKTKLKEFDYPSGAENQYTTYTGSGGVQISSFWKKLIFALRFSNLKILFSSDITSASRIMYYRRIRERLGKIAPFLAFDTDPYPVLAQGKIYWICDAYTLTDKFPYAEPYSGLGNYIRNSVKVVIDAYNGRTDFYISDSNDPLIKSFQKIFPQMFSPLEKMPAELQKHLRYPETLFKIQAGILTVYHMTDPRIFYNKEDLWEIPREIYAGEEKEVQAYYTIMKIPGASEEEFILMLPFSPKGKNNMSAWMCVRCDRPYYGEIRLYKFPKKKLVYGLRQIEARIDQDPEISKQLSLWNQRGSQVIRGNLLAIPIEDSLLYVEPIYLRAEQGQIPELRRVVVAFGGRLAMEETFNGALERVFAAGLPATSGPEFYLGATIEEALRYLEEAESKSRTGDWAGFGAALRNLKRALQELKAKGK